MPYLIYPTGNLAAARISEDATVTGLTAATGYTVHRLSQPGTFTTASGGAMANILGQLDGAGAAVSAAFGNTLTALTTSPRSDTDGYAAGLRAAHVPTGAFVVAAEVSKTVTSGNVSILMRLMGGVDTTFTLRYGTALTGAPLLAQRSDAGVNATLAAGSYGLLDMGETYRLWIKISAVPASTNRVMLNINNDAGSQSWRRAALWLGADETLPWAAAA